MPPRYLALRRRVPPQRGGRHDQPARTAAPKKLGLVIDLDTCVGCHACAVACKEWNTGGHPAPLTDQDPYGAAPRGVWFNRVHSFEAGEGRTAARCISRSPACIARTPACVTVCPTGASYKRAEDGIVLVDEDTVHRLQAVLLGLPLRRARIRLGRRRDEEMHAVHRPHLQREPPEERPRAGLRAHLPDRRAPFRRSRRSRIAVSKLVAERGGYDLMPELGYRPSTNTCRRARGRAGNSERRGARAAAPNGGFLRWLDRVLSRLTAHASGAFRSSCSPPPPAPATASCSCSALARASALLPPIAAGSGWPARGAGAGADHGRPAVSIGPSRPSRARLARASRSGARPGCRARAYWRSRPIVPACSGSAGSARADGGFRPVRHAGRGALGARHGLLHRDDLRLAEADRAVAPAAGPCRSTSPSR